MLIALRTEMLRGEKPLITTTWTTLRFKPDTLQQEASE